MDGLSLNGSCNRMASLTREKEEKRAQERRRNLLYLIAEHLREQGYTDACESLVKEAYLSPDIAVCDNIELETILLEYSDYYFAKFNKYPKICKKGEAGFANLSSEKSKKDKNIKINNRNPRKLEDSNASPTTDKQKTNNCITPTEPNFNITVTPLFPAENLVNDQVKNIKELSFGYEKCLKPLGSLYPSGSEWREIADIITKEIVLSDLNVRWEDVKGLDTCKNLLKEAAVYPIKYSYMFNDRLTPWKGVLLYGPPGTGKTMLAKAVATECNATFFNITSSSLVSKWRGESEKYVRVLLDLAKYHAPSIIFIDEVDWTVGGGAHDSTSKSEPSRRFRAELLARIDGLLSMENAKVLMLAATNVPWDLDTALLRRLEKRIFVDLPDKNARHDIFKIYLKPSLLDKEEYKALLEETKGYSCADLKLLCKEAWMIQLRPVWEYLEGQTIPLKEYTSDDGINDLSQLTQAMKTIKPIAMTSIKYQEWDGSYSTYNKNFSIKKFVKRKCEKEDKVDHEHEDDHEYDGDFEFQNDHDHEHDQSDYEFDDHVPELKHFKAKPRFS